MCIRDSVGSERFQQYHQQHMKRITYVVAPLMLSELVTGCYLVYVRHEWELVLNFALLLLIWLSTAALQVPAHNALAETYTDKTARKLVTGNWVRTLVWTARAALLVSLMI